MLLCTTIFIVLNVIIIIGTICDTLVVTALLLWLNLGYSSKVFPGSLSISSVSVVFERSTDMERHNSSVTSDGRGIRWNKVSWVWVTQRNFHALKYLLRVSETQYLRGWYFLCDHMLDFFYLS